MIKSYITYAVLNIDNLSIIDFSQIGETSIDTIRKNLDLTKFVVKWNTEPTFITDGSVTPIQVLSYSEALELMHTDKWSEDITA